MKPIAKLSLFFHVVSTFAWAPHSMGQNYAEALQKSLFFYDVQRSGPLPHNFRVTWRGDSGLEDGKEEGVDLSGGWFDAGDHVKFGFPAASTATLLAWSLIEDREAYKNSLQYSYALDNLKWINDYFLKAHSSKEVLWGQVGEGGPDHGYWGPPEVMPMVRKSFKIDPNCPGSDLAGETSAAMAAASIVFAPELPEYAKALLTHSKELYEFAYDHRGIYSDCIRDAASFYRSSGYMDELVWASLWLFRATQESRYLENAEFLFSSLAKNGEFPFQWTHAWDDKTYGSYILLHKFTKKKGYLALANKWLDYWTVGTPEGRVRYTPAGLAWLDMWGSLRYSANTAMLALFHSRYISDIDPEKSRIYWNFGKSQIDYMLGKNPRNQSFVIGYGVNYPLNAHHRAAHASWANNINIPSSNRHILYGALVGGPDLNDNYLDDRSDYVKNEVATDYNAGFQGALGALLKQYGGQIAAPFPPAEKITEEFFTTARVNSEGDNHFEIALKLHNHSAWPARLGDELKTRYFFSLSEISESRTCVERIKVTTNYNQGAKVSEVLVHNVEKMIYYIEADFSESGIKPSGEYDSQKEVQIRLTLPPECGKWQSQNDWSFNGLESREFKNTPNIPVYEKNRLVWGSQP